MTMPFLARRLAVLAVLLLAAAPSRAQDAVPAPLRGAYDYLVQSVCTGPGGRVLPGVSPLDGAACPQFRKLRVGEALPYHKQDWAGTGDRAALPDGYQRSDSFPVQTTMGLAVVQTYDFGDGDRAFGRFDASDGGQVAFFTPDSVAFGITEDGGAGLQFFIGPECKPLDSWVVVDRTFGAAPTGQSLARITRRQDRCPQDLGTAATRWTVRPMTFPTRTHGHDGSATLTTLVTEHYSRAAVDRSDSLERMYFTHELGYTRWERWQNLGVHNRARFRQQADQIEASERCSPGLGTPPEGGPWVMIDCRQWTNIVPPAGPAGDPATFWVDRLRQNPRTAAIFGP